MAIRIVSVLKTPRSSYNPDRPMSGLLASQVTMLEEALLTYEPAYASRRRKPKTEKEAAKYVTSLHARLNEHKKASEDAQTAAAAAMTVVAGVAAASARVSAAHSVATRDGGKRFASTRGPSVSVRQLTAPVAATPAPAASRARAGVTSARPKKRAAPRTGAKKAAVRKAARPGAKKGRPR